MQECPFCKFNYTEVGLQEGRCPQCTAMVSWPVEPQNSPELPIAMSIEQRSEERFKAVENIWRQTVTSATKLNQTIKTNESEVTVNDSVYSIQPRDVKQSVQIQYGDELDYELINVIGEGGIGVVYAARQASIDRRVAIKMLREEYRDREEHRDKFLAEAVLTGELDHPNIVPIYDLGRNDQGELFYAMKNVVGTPWDRVLATYSLRGNLDVLLKVSDAIAFAHSRGIVHRDLKPENVMIGSFGEVLVMDWGIALPTEGFRKSSSILRSQAMGGTPAYMAPELATGPGSKIGRLSDVYLLGAILFEILSGTPPHNGIDVMDCVRNAAKNIIVPTTVTGELMDIAMKAMSTIPGRRYHSVLDFQNAIRVYESHSDSLALSENAEEELRVAKEGNNYQDYSRALFGFQEALALWDQNDAARTGEAETRIAYADAALKKGDFDLGLSLLDDKNELDRPLIAALKQSIKERDARQSRLKTVKRLVASLACFIIVAGSIGMAFIYNLYSQSKELNRELKISQEKTAKQAEDNKKLYENANEQKTLAEEKRQEAEDAQRQAEIAQREAEASRLETVAEKQRAEESAYFAETGLIGASIQENNFTIAANLLDQLEQSPAKSKLRHWEWGRYQYVVQGGIRDAGNSPVQSNSQNASVISIDSGGRSGAILVGFESGELQYWRSDSREPMFSVKHGVSLADAELDSTGTRIVSVGVDDQRRNTIKVWRVADGTSGALEQTIDTGSLVLKSVGFSKDDKASMVVAGGSPRLARIWNWRDKTEVSSLRSHMDTITRCEFSPDSKIVATASVDGSVRLWNVSDGVEVQRFTGHRLAVYGLSFSPDGRYIASGGIDRRVLLWKVQPSSGVETEVQDLKNRLDGKPIAEAVFETLAGHTGTINDIAFSQDGQRLVSSSNDNTVLVWKIDPIVQELNTQTSTASSTAKTSPQLHAPETRLRGHGGWVRVCAFLADDSQVLSGSDDRTWKKWRHRDYQELRILGDGRTAITDADYSPNGDLLATAHADGVIKLWDTKLGSLRGSLGEGHDYLTNRAYLIGNEQTLITAAGDNTIRVWDTDQGTQLAVLQQSGRNAKFSVSSDERWLVSTGDASGIPIWDLNSLEPRTRFRVDGQSSNNKQVGAGNQNFVEPSCVAISSNGSRVLIGDRNGKIEFWDGMQGQLLETAIGHSKAIVDIHCLSGLGDESQSAISISADGTVAWWDIAKGKELDRQRLLHYATLQSSAINSPGTRLVTSATVGVNQSRLWMWDLQSGELVQTKDMAGELVQDLSFDISDPEKVFVTTTNPVNSTKDIWSWTANGFTNRFGPAQLRGNTLWGVRVSQKTQRLVAFGGRGARLWNLASAQEQMAYRPATSLTAIRFSPDGKLVASGAADGVVTLWDAESQKSVRKLMDGHKNKITGIAFCPIRQELVSTSIDGTITVWDLESGKSRVSLNSQQNAWNALTIAHDESCIIVGSRAGTIHRIELDQLQELQQIETRAGDINAICISPDGKRIASGGSDKLIRIWDYPAMREMARLVGHSATIKSVVFSNDGLRILSTSQDSTVRLWDMDRITTSRNTSLNKSNEVITSLGELAALDYHSGETTRAVFSPSGKEIVSSGSDGYAVIWPSQPLPPSLRLSKPSISGQLDTFVSIDTDVVVSTPFTGGLSGCQLNCRMTPQEGIVDQISLELPPSQLTLNGDKLSIIDSRGKIAEIGTVRSEDEGRSLTIVFLSNVDQPTIRMVASNLQYRLQSKANNVVDVEREISIHLVDAQGRTSNRNPEIMRVKLPIGDIRSRESDAE